MNLRKTTLSFFRIIVLPLASYAMGRASEVKDHQASKGDDK